MNPDAVPLTEVAGTIVNSMGGALGSSQPSLVSVPSSARFSNHSGGTQSLANSLVKIFGVKKAPWAMLLTGFIISIPVFLDVALVILAPLLFALARDTKKPYLIYGLTLVAGMAVTHAFVPPTPGPVVVAYILGVNLGYVILFGIVVGFPTAVICGPWLCTKMASKVDLPLPPLETGEPLDDSNLPSFRFILFLIAMPIGLILANTIVEQMFAASLPEGLSKDERGSLLKDAMAGAAWWKQGIIFFGHPVIALLISTITALHFLGTRRGVDRETLLEVSTKALGPAGIIILITGAGGVFKGVLKETGITEALELMFTDSGIPILVLAYVFATVDSSRARLRDGRDGDRSWLDDQLCGRPESTTTGVDHDRDRGGCDRFFTRQ